MKRMITSALLLAFPIAAANAKTIWSVGNTVFLEARSSEPETDADLRAYCLGGLVTIRIGGSIGVGKGGGEPVSVKVEGDGKSAKVQGVSMNTPDAEMTGGAELVTDLRLESPEAEILFSGKAVKIVTPDHKTHTLFDADTAGEVKKFVKKCRG